MKLTKVLIAVTLFLILQTPNLFASDWEYWSKYSFSTKLAKKIDLKVEPEFRMKSEFGHFYYHRIYVGPVFKLSKFLKISPLYSYKTSEKNKNWDNEDITDLDIELKIPFLSNSSLNYRSRCEYNFTTDIYILRNRFKLSKDYKGLTYSVSDEVFYNFDTDKSDENRAEIGVSKKLTKNLTLDLSYILRYRKTNHWYSANILQTALKVNF